MSNLSYNLFISLCNELNKLNISYVIARRIDSLATLGSSDDVDIVIHPKDFSSCVKIFNQTSEQRFILRKYIKNSKLAQFHFAIFEENQWAYLQIDIHTAIRHEGIELVSYSHLLDNKRQYESLWRPHAAAEMVALLLHDLISKKHIPEQDQHAITNLYQQCPEDAKTLLTKLLGHINSGIIVRSLQQNDFSAISAIKNNIYRKFLIRNLFSVVSERISHFLSLVPHVIFNRGISVVLIGPDGSGKTTLATNLQNLLTQSSLKVGNVYYGLTQPILPTKKIMRWIRYGKNKQSNQTNFEFKPKQLNLKKRIAHLLGALHAFIDIYLRYFVFSRQKLSRGHIVLSDRYFYDLLTFPIPAFLQTPFRFLVTKLTPRPDLTFIILDDKENIYNRKPELSIEEIERQQNIFQYLEYCHVNAFIFKQTPDISANTLSLSHIILQQYARKNGIPAKTHA